MTLSRLAGRLHGRTGVAGAAALLVATALASAGCLGGGDTGQWAFGRILKVHVSNAQRVSSVAYLEGGAHYVVRPDSPEQELVVARVIVRNDLSARVSLLVDPEAAALEDDRLTSYPAMDPYQRREAVSQAAPGEDRFLPFIWGQMDLAKGYQIEGWMLFQVPVGAPVTRLRWDQAETVMVAVKVR